MDLVVSNGLGKKRITVPHIIGLELTKAVQKVRKSGLRVGQIRYKPSRNTVPNTVLNYFPKVREAVVGSTLQFVVSELPGTTGSGSLYRNRHRAVQDTSSSFNSNTNQFQ